MVWISRDLSQMVIGESLRAGIRRAKEGKAGPPGSREQGAGTTMIISHVVLTAHRHLNITFSLAASIPIFSLLDRPLQLSVRGRRRKPYLPASAQRAVSSFPAVLSPFRRKVSSTDAEARH